MVMNKLLLIVVVFLDLLGVQISGATPNSDKISALYGLDVQITESNGRDQSESR
jgi:hypothetical protein